MVYHYCVQLTLSGSFVKIYCAWRYYSTPKQWAIGPRYSIVVLALYLCTLYFLRWRYSIFAVAIGSLSPSLCLL